MNKNVIEMKKWLLDHGIRQVDVAKNAGLPRQRINNVIHGRERNRKVLKALESIGFPVDLLKVA